MEEESTTNGSGPCFAGILHLSEVGGLTDKSDGMQAGVSETKQHGERIWQSRNMESGFQHLSRESKAPPFPVLGVANLFLTV